jgi:hypothetical protein
MDRLTELSTQLIARTKLQALDILESNKFTLPERSEIVAMLFAYKSNQHSVILESVKTISACITSTLQLSHRLGHRLLNPL